MLLLKLPSLPEPITIDSIICVEADVNYTWIHYRRQEHDQKYLSAKTLKWVETQLVGFVRIHQSILINPTHIAQITIKGFKHMVIRMTNGMTLPVARRRIEGVRQQLQQRIPCL